jgi:carbon-monoxide dehydrogenase small subunit
MNQPIDVSLTINGERRVITTQARRTLADVLREDLGLTGTHLGCEHGVCGACTVLVDDRPARSCLMLIGQADGTEVITVEGLAHDGQLHPVQEGFYDSHSFQCGFCTPGFVMTTYALLAENPNPTREEIRAGISENLCRCTGYQSILDGVERGAQLWQAAREGGRDTPATGTSAATPGVAGAAPSTSDQEVSRA